MGNHQLMLDSLERLMQLPAELVVHSGHGPVTSLKQELVNNPFLTFLR
jgi:glyoxylase-like metal-dependent hydrolase (beta-lactamase superfamily II)